MPLVAVDNAGTCLEYIDSGAPQSDRYNTVFVIHGHSWGAGCFAKSLSLASSYGIRLVVLNRRGFGNSTSLSPSEIEPLEKATSGDAHTRFIQDRINEISMCIAHLEHDRSSGITLMGWSLGNLYCVKLIEMLKNGSIKADVAALLRGYIAYEAPYWSLSYPPPAPEFAKYSPQLTGPYSDNLKGRVLNEWLGAYFDYPAITDPKQFFIMEPRGNTGRPTTMDSMDKEGVYGTREVSLEPGGVDLMSPRQSGFDPRNSKNENTFLRGIALGVFNDSATSVFFNKQSSGEKWDGPVSTLYSLSACWITAYGNWRFEQDVKSGIVKIPVTTLGIRNANHFMHWDNPEEFLRATKRLLEGSNGQKSKI